MYSALRGTWHTDHIQTHCKTVQHGFITDHMVLKDAFICSLLLC